MQHPKTPALLLRLAIIGAALFSLNALAAPGDLYVAEATGGHIYRFTPAGKKSIFASDLSQPVALAFDRQGNLFVGNSGSCMSSDGSDCSQPSVIFKFTPLGEKSTFATIGSTTLLDMAFDGAGNLFVSDGGSILKIAPDGTPSTFAFPVDGVWPLAFDQLGHLDAGVAPLGPGAILQFAPDGSRSTFASLPAGGSATDLAFDPQGDLFVLFGLTILKITPGGDQTTFASGDFTAFAFDGSGNLFVGQNAYNASEPALVKLNPGGTKTTFASGVLLPSALAFEPVTEKLRNLSARGMVGTGDDVLIAGFIVGGSALANNSVVARAIGPSLSTAGVSDPLADPVLELHNESGAIIASNDDWQDSQEDQIKASGLAPKDSHESAIFATLPAGNFTAVIRGAGDTTGVALVEIYGVNQ